MEKSTTHLFDDLHEAAAKARRNLANLSSAVFNVRNLYERLSRSLSDRSDMKYVTADARMLQAVLDMEQNPGSATLAQLGSALALYRVAALSEAQQPR
ncbi:hypothetical protein [Variibacter gotjawalensis]|uniref:hypothetical protein n=1 Tax=Variibacter gotjawalensis TaxID=1333996 RepID=UPI00102C1C8D|nr:hypothetical protein [Variibacter gotjawalensis]NIK47719.1 hypothetical protein [Variibacter gotjawalensis]